MGEPNPAFVRSLSLVALLARERPVFNFSFPLTLHTIETLGGRGCVQWEKATKYDTQTRDTTQIHAKGAES